LLNHQTTSHIYTLSLHDALPISLCDPGRKPEYQELCVEKRPGRKKSEIKIPAYPYRDTHRKFRFGTLVPAFFCQSGATGQLRAFSKGISDSDRETER